MVCSSSHPSRFVAGAWIVHSKERIPPMNLVNHRIIIKAAFVALCLLVANTHGATVTWQWELGPDIPSPGPNSISDGSLVVTVDVSSPTLVIDQADSRGWYVSQWAITGGQVILDGEAFNITGGGVVAQTQCWDTDIFPNPGCGFDLDRVSVEMYLDSGGYLAAEWISSPEVSNLLGYPLWTDRPMTTLTNPLPVGGGFESFAQGHRYALDADDPGVFTFGIESWTLVSPVPILTCTGFMPPFDAPLSIKKKSKRTIPVDMMLRDEDGDIVTDGDIVAPPVINVAFQGAATGDVPPVSNELMSVGSANDGNMFRFDTDSQQWIYNLGTRYFAAPGVYLVTVQSGDTAEYQITSADGNCAQTFERLP